MARTPEAQAVVAHGDPAQLLLDRPEVVLALGPRLPGPDLPVADVEIRLKLTAPNQTVDRPAGHTQRFTDLLEGHPGGQGGGESRSWRLTAPGLSSWTRQLYSVCT